MGPEAARVLAAGQLCRVGRRWDHAQAVGRLAESLASRGVFSTEVCAAAWLHDVGYAPSVARTAFHPMDGARFLLEAGFSNEIVGLVAHHTGAKFEAEERGLDAELAALPTPNADDLDALTLLDLVVGPTGEFMSPEGRIAEILTRYSPGDPVHRAVTRSAPTLLASAKRARARLGLSDEWPLDAAEGVVES